MQNGNGTLIKKGLRCTSCGKKAVKAKADYKFTESGLDNVVLSGINVYKCSCGKISPEIRNVERLRWIIAMEFLRKPNLLGGKELRFLRKQMKMRRSTIAFWLDVDPPLVSKWERSDTKIGIAEDRDIRMLYVDTLERKYQEIVREISSMEAFKARKKDIVKLENSDFKKSYEATLPEFDILKIQLKRPKYLSAKAWRYRYYFRCNGRAEGSWQAQGVKNDSQIKNETC